MKRIMTTLSIVFLLTIVSQAQSLQGAWGNVYKAQDAVKQLKLIQKAIENGEKYVLTEKQVRDNLHFKLNECTATLMPEGILTESHKECLGDKKSGDTIILNIDGIELQARISLGENELKARNRHINPNAAYNSFSTPIVSYGSVVILKPVNFEYIIPEDIKYKFANVRDTYIDLPHKYVGKYKGMFTLYNLNYYYANDAGYEKDNEIAELEVGPVVSNDLTIIDMKKFFGIARRGSVLVDRNRQIIGIYKDEKTEFPGRTSISFFTIED